jgi:hypothetical protein
VKFSTFNPNQQINQIFEIITHFLLWLNLVV